MMLDCIVNFDVLQGKVLFGYPVVMVLDYRSRQMVNESKLAIFLREETDDEATKFGRGGLGNGPTVLPRSTHSLMCERTSSG